jgi:hypothetical protein
MRPATVAGVDGDFKHVKVNIFALCCVLSALCSLLSAHCSLLQYLSATLPPTNHCSKVVVRVRPVIDLEQNRKQDQLCFRLSPPAEIEVLDENKETEQVLAFDKVFPPSASQVLSY